MTERLINDLMDLAKVENNRFTINKDYFNLSQTIANSLQIMFSTASLKQIKLTAIIDDENNLKLIQAIIGDGQRY